MSVEPIQKAIKRARRSLKDQSPTFFVVPSDNDERPRTVALDDNMAAEMLGIAMTALQHADDYDPIEYDPDHRIARGTEEVLLVPLNRVDDDSVVFDIVQSLDSLTDIHAREMVEIRTKMYGVAFGTTPEQRIVFVRLKRIEGITADGKLFAIAGDTLRAIKQPGMVIDRAFDLIVFPQGIAAFDSVTFERLVKDPKDVSAELLKNARTVAKDVPFAPGLLKKLIARGQDKPMIRRKLRSIVERNHLSGVTISEIKKALRRQGKVPSDYVNGDKLDFDMSDAMFMLGFLDEGTWRGWRSNTHYAAGGRSVVK
jgi:hypothetical protein